MGITEGTNYYLKLNLVIYNPKKAEGSGWTHLHIGKSSFGWCFSLRVIPELGLNSLEAWKNFMKGGDKIVVDEQGSEISKREMVRIITQRHHPRYGMNFMGLARHRVDGIGVISHGKGTWDLVTDEFFSPNDKRFHKYLGK